MNKSKQQLAGDKFLGAIACVGTAAQDIIDAKEEIDFRQRQATQVLKDFVFGTLMAEDHDYRIEFYNRRLVDCDEVERGVRLWVSEQHVEKVCRRLKELGLDYTARTASDGMRIYPRAADILSAA